MINSASVSKDGHNAWTRGHPSRRAQGRAPEDEVGMCFTAAKAGYPVRRGLSTPSQLVWVSGSSGFADDDDRGDEEYCMPEFRLTQISDTHLARRLSKLTDNFDRVREYIDTSRPDLVVNSGDVAFDGPTSPDDLRFARELHDALPVPCRYLPGNHDIGDHPTQVGPAPSQLATEADRQALLSTFAEDRWRFEAAGWCFIGLHSLVMNTCLASEAEQFDWRASQLAAARGKPVALFLHTPLSLNSPEDPALPATAI